MTAQYDDAVTELSRAPLATFMAERKRLVGELKAAGDKTGARMLGQRAKPPVSVWAVNQLWWQAREAFDKLFATAERLRDGDLGGTAAHREALAALRTRASALLVEAGHSATESTLRRIATTLSAIAAIGNFDPDQPGTLSDDRDPPGFEAAGIPGLAASVKSEPEEEEAEADDKPAKAKTANQDTDTDVKRRAIAEAAAEKAQAAAERRKAEEAKAKKLAKRHQHEAALRTAQGDVERRKREVDRLRAAVADAETALEKAEAIAVDLEAKLEELSED